MPDASSKGAVAHPQRSVEWEEISRALEDLAGRERRLKELERNLAELLAKEGVVAAPHQMTQQEPGARQQPEGGKGQDGQKKKPAAASEPAAEEGAESAVCEVAPVVAGSEGTAGLAAVQEAVRQLEGQLERERNARVELEARLPTQALGLEYRKPAHRVVYVNIQDTRCYHVERSGWEDQHPVHWRTVCGLEHGGVTLARRATREWCLPPGLPLGRKGVPPGRTVRCAKCFGGEDEAAQDREGGVEEGMESDQG